MENQKHQANGSTESLVSQEQGLERIESAAIRQNGVIHAGLNHAAIISDIYELTGRPVWGEQGFITVAGRFVDRKEGLRIAEAANQIKHKHPNFVTLYSEDLNCEYVECPYYSTQVSGAESRG